MDTPEFKSPSAPETPDLAAQIASLQRQVTTLLLALVVLSGTFTALMFMQARGARRDLAAIKQPATQLIQAFNQEKPIMDNFIARLADFGRTNPEFVPILNKYRIPVATSAIPATVTPPVATPPAQK
jgi:hypothetical protein